MKNKRKGNSDFNYYVFIFSFSILLRIFVAKNRKYFIV